MQGTKNCYCLDPLFGVCFFGVFLISSKPPKNYLLGAATDCCQEGRSVWYASLRNDPVMIVASEALGGDGYVSVGQIG